MWKVIIGIIAVLVLALVGSYYLGFLPPQQVTSGEEAKVNPPSSSVTSAEGGVEANPPASLPTSAETDVRFQFAVSDISGSGLSRTGTSQLSNTGSSDAHNVWAKVEVFCQGSRVKVSGQDYLKEDIGILKAGETVTREVTLSFSVFDGLKISNNGARFILTVYSDEHTETLSYDYQP